MTSFGLPPAEAANRGTIMRALGERLTMGTTASGEELWRGNELADDAAAGDGVREVTVEDGVSQTTTVTMNGTTAVDLTPDDVRFVNCFYTSDVGSTGVAVGHIRLQQGVLL